MEENEMLKKVMPLTALILLAQVILAGQEIVNRSFDVRPGGKLVIKSGKGSITVSTHEQNRVEVSFIFKSKTASDDRIKEYIEDLDLKMTQSGNDVLISLEKFSMMDRWTRHLDVQFEVTVPGKYGADLSTSGGSIQVGDLEGDVASRTSGGSLRFGSISGNVEGRTSGGSIFLSSIKGSVDLHTSGGSIEAGDVSGNITAHTSGGSIILEQAGGIVDAQTSGGSINAKITGQPEDDCQLKTSGGNVSVKLNPDIRILLDAQTSGGGISTDFPVVVKGSIGGNQLNAEINGGGPALVMRTSGGSIHIKKIGSMGE
jgi:DUF4097 and DUF4098 domain-containing protein YvlB